MAKGEGSRGGSIIGHTRSGKPVYSSNSPHYKAISKLKGNAQQRAMNEQFAGWDSEDHRDALDLHDAQIPGSTTAEKRKGKSSMSFKAAALHYTKRQIMRMGETGEEPENDDPPRHATKSAVTDFFKASGEGSRGGKVIGHTNSGKPIYAVGHPKYENVKDPNPMPDMSAQIRANADSVIASYKDFDADDHYDAELEHGSEAYNNREKNPKLSEWHSRLADAHGLAATKLGFRFADQKSLENDMAKSTKGEGSRGGSIIGHTKSGKPIYGANHAKYQSSLKLLETDFGASANERAIRMFENQQPYSAEDHAEAATVHEKVAAKLNASADLLDQKYQETRAQEGGAAAYAKFGKKGSQAALLAEKHTNVAAMHRKEADHWGVKSFCKSTKGEGAHGGHVIGHTRSGKPIYRAVGSHMHDVYSKVNSHTHRDVVVDRLHSHFRNWSPEDHDDAMSAHHAELKRLHRENGAQNQREAADMAVFSHGVLRDHERDKRKKSVSKSLDDVLGIYDAYWAQQQAQEAEAMLTVTQPLNPGGDGGCPIPPKPARPAGQTYEGPPFRVDVLAPTPMSAHELVAVAKSIQALPKSQWQTEFVRAGVPVVAPRQVDLQKGRLTVQEFADAVGTNEETVRRLANRCGDAEHFLALIKDKMPDIQRAHSLSDEDATALYAATRRTIKSLTPYEFEHWRQPPSFANGAVTDKALADTIRFNGFMNRNAVLNGTVSVQPRRDLASPEPIGQLEHRPLLPMMSPNAFRS